MANVLLWDTNILVYFIDGNINAEKVYMAHDVILSSITFIEILSNKHLSAEKRTMLRNTLMQFPIIETAPLINKLAINMRLNYNLDTTDAIIAATAKYLSVPLITADAAFYNIKEIAIIPFLK